MWLVFLFSFYFLLLIYSFSSWIIMTVFIFSLISILISSIFGILIYGSLLVKNNNKSLSILEDKLRDTKHLNGLNDEKLSIAEQFNGSIYMNLISMVKKLLSFQKLIFESNS